MITFLDHGALTFNNMGAAAATPCHAVQSRAQVLIAFKPEGEVGDNGILNLLSDAKSLTKPHCPQLYFEQGK